MGWRGPHTLKWMTSRRSFSPPAAVVQDQILSFLITLFTWSHMPCLSQITSCSISRHKLWLFIFFSALEFVTVFPQGILLLKSQASAGLHFTKKRHAIWFVFEHWLPTHLELALMGLHKKASSLKRQHGHQHHLSIEQVELRHLLAQKLCPSCTELDYRQSLG